MDKAQEKGKAAEVPDVPLLADTPYQRQMRQRVIINLKPVIERLDAQEEILCSLQSDVNSIFMSQASTSKELSQVKNVVRWFNKELGSMKTMLSEILKAVGTQAPPPPPADQRSEEGVPRPSGPDEQEAGPSGPAAASPPAKTEEQWARGHRELYKKFVLAKSARFPPRDHSLTLSEWFQIHHKHCWAPFIQKEIKMARHFQLFNNYRYVHRLPEVQFSQFKQAIDALGTSDVHSEAIQVDFATLQVPEKILLPPIHSLVMDSSVGSIIFERFARVMGRIKVQKGLQVAFHRFLFREYHQGHVSAEVLAPILSECERLTPSDWARFYPLSAQQLLVLNECQAREGHPPVSEAIFLDMNSIHLVQDPFQIWVERYKVYVALCQELKAKQNFYPISVDQFLARASFGSISFKSISLDRDAYANFLDEQLALHLKRMAPSMGPKYTLAPGVFRQVFEKQEEHTWEIISRFASLLSPAFYLPVPSQNE
ncbi:hypothetical protein Taro_044047 [Colocasia esculenta]|uniref:Uncharacterized protein n=1 Tax=Colocasia esculenta TaxID=4460 RepID=A0A843X2P4_COLES|nr:hypothetical protein [Colocasia esculenta]